VPQDAIKAGKEGKKKTPAGRTDSLYKGGGEGPGPRRRSKKKSLVTEFVTGNGDKGEEKSVFFAYVKKRTPSMLSSTQQRNKNLEEKKRLLPLIKTTRRKGERSVKASVLGREREILKKKTSKSFEVKKKSQDFDVRKVARGIAYNG